MSTPQPVVAIDKITATNPATGEVIGYSPIDTPEQGRQAIIRARKAQPAWAALPLKERTHYIWRLRDYLVDHADEVSDVISKDVGKTHIEALATEVLPSVMAITYYARHARRFLKPSLDSSRRHPVLQQDQHPVPGAIRCGRRRRPLELSDGHSHARNRARSAGR